MQIQIPTKLPLVVPLELLEDLRLRSDPLQTRKIIIFGATGMLGRYVYTYFSKLDQYQVIVIPFRITSETLDTLNDVLISHGIDDKTCVINCIGQIPQRKSANSDDHVYFFVNSIFPHLLWTFCKMHGAKMIQPATDCVFSGKGRKYLETDIHDETSAYGLSKSLGEPHGATIIRTSIIGREIVNKKSFLEWVVESGLRGDTIRGWTNHWWNGITCLEYCKILDTIIRTNGFWSGVKHIYSPTEKNKYELAQMVADVFDFGDLEILSFQDEKGVTDKTLSSIYENKYNIQELFDQIKELKDFELARI